MINLLKIVGKKYHWFVFFCSVFCFFCSVFFFFLFCFFFFFFFFFFAFLGRHAQREWCGNVLSSPQRDDEYAC